MESNSSFSLLGITEPIIIRIISYASNDIQSMIKWTFVNHYFHLLLNDPDVLKRIAKDNHTIPLLLKNDLYCLERFGFYYSTLFYDNEMNRINKCVFFHYASTKLMKDRSEASGNKITLNKALKILKKFPNARLYIDAHVGFACPAPLASQYSLRRGLKILEWFAKRYGNNSRERDQIVLNNWGRQVARQGEWEDDESTSRCELHFSLLDSFWAYNSHKFTIWGWGIFGQVHCDTMACQACPKSP